MIKMTTSIWRSSTKCLLLAPLLATAVSCGYAPSSKPAPLVAPAFGDVEAKRSIREENSVSQARLDALEQFSMFTASRILSEGQGNTLYSPYSLYVALALAASGAEGATQKEMLSLLGGNSPGNISRLAADTGKLIRLLHTDNEIGRLKTANSMWIQQGHSFKKEYEKLASASFYASLHTADFTQKETAEKMGEWVREHTGGQITPTIQPDPQQVIALLNTLDFKDEWLDAFNESQTVQGMFYPEEGGQLTAAFMSRNYYTADYIKKDRFASATLRLKNGGAMTFVLPDKGVSVKELVTTPEKTRALLPASGKTTYKLDLKVPKFDYSSKLELVQALKAMGMNAPFTDQANFSVMSDTSVYISQITQNTHIAIDEKGVEAAAFTEIFMAGSGLPKGEAAELVLDRPFLYSITAANGTVLFTGICQSP
jgi:serine protease inhibitor